jgi:hypothetical protein
MIPASSASKVNALDNVETVATTDARASALDALNVLANYAPELPADEPAAPVATARVRRRVKSKNWVRLYETAAVGLALSGLAVGYLAWRLSEGTISISAATPIVEDTLERIVGGQAKIGGLRLGWDSDARNFVVIANNITATTDARTSPLALGRVDLTLNARALLAGRAQITRAELTGLQAVLVIDKNGRTAFGFGTPAEVLALPRKKGESRGLRPILDSVRKAVLLDDKNGRVEAIALRNAQLMIIDPDTNQRLTLSNAQANVTTNTDNIVTMQAAGFATEMGGYANIAISADPDRSQRLVMAARFENARLSSLPASLRVGPLARVGSDTVPISGKVVVQLGDGEKTSDVNADLAFGAGQFQGFDLSRATGKLVWDGVKGSFAVSNLSANGPQIQVEAGNGNLIAAPNGQKSIAFDARKLAIAVTGFGNLSSVDIRGSARVDAKNLPMSGSMTGREIRFASQSVTSLTAQGFGLVLASPNPRQPSQVQANLTAQGVSGTIQGRPVGARGLNFTLDATRDGIKLTPTQLSGNASQLRAGLVMDQAWQSFDATGLVVAASGFTAQRDGHLSLPSIVTLSATEIMVGKGDTSPLAGSATGIAFEGRDLNRGSARLTGTIAQLANATSNDGRFGANGRDIAFDITQSGVNSGKVNSFNASALSVAAGNLSVAIEGLVANGNYSGQTLVGVIAAANSVEIAHTAQLVRPFWADDLRLAGDLSARSANLSAFGFRHRDVDIAGSTQIALAPRGSPSVLLDADVKGEFSVETLLSAWPRRFLPDTRESIRRLVPSGIAEVSRLSLAIPAGMAPKQVLPKNGIGLDFSLRDVTVTYLPGMSPITGVRGQGTLTGNSMLIELPSGSIGDIALTDATVEIPEFKPVGAHVAIEAKIAGDVTAIAQEIDLPALALLSNAGLDPARLSGAGSAILDLNIPLKPALMANDIGVTVSGDFQQAGLSQAFAGLDASNGKVHLDVLDGKIDVFGKAWLAGNMFNFKWGNDPSAKIGAQVQFSANGDVTIDSLQAIGIDARPYASGPFAIDVATNSDASLFGETVVKADFRNTIIRLPGNVWGKDEGLAAFGSARLYPREGGGWNVQNLNFDSSGATLRGALDIAESGKLVDARFSRVVIENAADLTVDVTPTPDSLTVTMRGAYLNLSPYLDSKDVSGKAVVLLDRPLTLSADIARVATGPGKELANVHADIIRDRDGWRTLEATGVSSAGRSQLSLNVQRDGRRMISGVLSDAGFFAQLLYPGATLFGGTGTIEGELPVVGANSSGNLTFSGKDIQLVREGLTPIMFDKVELPMSVQGGVVTLRDGQADGVAYTVKASGYVDVGAGRLDIRGVATPGGLNRVLADIPLFGAILGGGADEGLLGLTFTAQGPLTAPKLRSNPISALAPGFLRKLFESEAPLSPQPRLVVVPFSGQVVVEKWPYGPTEDMSERPNAKDQASGPTQ